MSSYTRARSRRQQRHSASRSQSHAKDKQLGDVRGQTGWVPVPAAQSPSPNRDFGKLDGHEFKCVRGKWSRCEQGEEYADYLEREARERSWYNDTTTRHGLPVKMKRPVGTPIEIMMVSFAPWASDWAQAQLKAGVDPRPKLAEIRNHWLKAARDYLGNLRYVLGYAFHADTSDLHFDLALSRQDGAGGRIGKPGLKLVGPWCVGTDRQLRAGAEINPTKRLQLQRSVANFRHREGEDEKPLDVLLARALDAGAEAVIGPELQVYREAYARRVPELERQHTRAQLAVLNAAREKLLDRAPPSRPEPEITLG